MKWIDVKQAKPKDDKNVLVTNDKINLDFHRAYYEEDSDCFFSLEAFHSFPLEVTHWTTLE